MIAPACLNCRPAATWAAAVAVVFLNAFAGPARAQPEPADPAATKPPAQAAAPPAQAAQPTLTLLDCLTISQERQPTIAAARASLAAREAAFRGLSELSPPSFLAPDLPIRRRQSCLGLTAARAELYQAEYDTFYAVIRLYYSAVYARQQLGVTDEVVRNLRFWHERVRDIVENQGGDREINQDTVDRLMVFSRLAESRQAEASAGVQRALAALREAMGVGPDFGPFQPADNRLPEPTVEPVLEQIIPLALARRGEIVQALVAAQVIRLEVDAQGRLRCRSSARTFAAGSDIHARSLPTGMRNGEYKPAAVGIEMPTMVAGNRDARQQQVAAYAGRADAVVEKTRGLITLEAEDAYQEWVESTRKATGSKEAARVARALADRLRRTRGVGNVRQEDLLQTDVLAGQAQAAYNQAVFEQILALANLERITAGGFNAGLVPTPAAPAAPPTPAAPAEKTP
jgi:outer membrane protein TolC